MDDRARGAARRAHHPVAFDIEAVAQRTAYRNALDPFSRAPDAIRHRLAPVVVDTDDRGAFALHAGDEPFLDRRIFGNRAVAIEMILGDVEQNADRGIERGREIDLERRALDHMDTPRRGRLEREDRGADIAAELHIVVRALE